MKNFALVLFNIFVFSSFAQTLNPVKWAAKYNDLGNGNGEIIITATIDKGWHIYSQRPTEDGPIPTSFVYNLANDFTLVGKTEEQDAKEEYVKAFEARVWVFDNEAVFKQKIKLANKSGFTTKVKLEYMTCNDIQCLPPKTIELDVNVPAKK